MSSQHDNGSPLQWDPIECKAYIVEVVGNTERYPQREDYEVGSLTLQNRLHRRYGEDYAKSCSKVLRDFLEDLETGTREEQEIWRLEKTWPDPKKVDFCTKIKGKVTELKIKFLNFIGHTPPSSPRV
ncbi:MAG: hypothetical protein L6R40_005792 [Gallowayella cf. fulva]|nr:MAG: hypothetical protein L6R40_005792 [Xanthomendoza cf. fulva]